MLATILLCLILSVTTSSELIGDVASPQGCVNGGLLMKLKNGTSSCFCQDHWTGEDCSEALCINGGNLVDNKCICASGFEGVHCERVRCEPTSYHSFDLDKPTLMLVVRVREQMNDVLQQVQQAVDKVVASLQSLDSRYLSRFAVVFFNDHTNLMSKQYHSIDDFDADFFKATISSNTDGGCTDAVLGAVTSSLSDFALTQGSTIYVITDALADEYDSGVEELIRQNSKWRATINFIYIEPTPDAHCVSNLTDPGFRAFEDVANSFGGMAFKISNKTNVEDVLYNHMNSIIYKSQLLLTIDREECESGLWKVLYLEKNTYNLIFITTGGVKLSIFDPVGNQLSSSLQVVVQEGQFIIQTLRNVPDGNYLFRMVTNDPTTTCSVRAYQTHDQSLSTDSPAEAFWAISTGLNTDALLYQPLADIDNHPVFHIENNEPDDRNGYVADYDRSFAFLNMYAVRGGVETEVYASSGLFRDGCTFTFYFPSFNCSENDRLYFEFRLRTVVGFYVQRAGVMTCLNQETLPTTTTTTPTTAPPTPVGQDAYCDCSVDKFGSPVGWKYNDIWLDLVVILDASEAMGKDALEEAGALIESFISDGVDDFLVTNMKAPFYTRVGVIVMTDTAQVLYNLNMTKTDKVQGKVAIKSGVTEINFVDAFNAAISMFDDGLKSKPDRANTRQVIYYITDSDSKNDLSSLNEFKESRGVIIVNNFLQKGEIERVSLKDLASPGFYFLNNNSMEGLQAFCKANCFCQPDKDAFGGADPAMQASDGCYHATSAGVPYNKAKTTCSNEGGILTSNHDDAKGRFLNQLMSSTASKSDYFWIGFQKSDDGVWRWDDQSNDGYTNWSEGEPNTATVAKCAYVDSTTSNLSWGAGNCQLGFPYVCQYRPCSVGYKDC